ncbi:hypothetical protein ACFLYY_00725 [Patescibacteria group bacterium]
MKISNITITPLPPSQSLVGFGKCVIDNWLEINSIGIHVKKDGGFRLVFPARKLNNGLYVFYYRPITKESEKEITLVFEKEIERLELFNFQTF